MARSTCSFILAAAFLIVTAMPRLVASDKPGFVPAWTKGQTWYVESRRVPMDLAGEKPGPADKFGPATVWEFRVAAVKEAGRLRYYQILVKDRAGKEKHRAGLVFIAELAPDGRPQLLTLAKATLESPFRGSLKRTTHDYRKETGGPHPVLTSESLIPIEMPCLSAASFGRTTSTTFDITDIAGGLPYARDIVQRVSRAVGTSRPVEEKLPFRGPNEPIRLGVTADPALDLDILLERPSDGSVAHQLWHPSQPWCLYSRTHTGVARLLEE